MVHSVLKSVHVRAALFSARLRRLRSGQTSYELVPTSPRLTSTMKSAFHGLNAFAFCLVLLLLTLSAVSAGLILRPSHSMKYTPLIEATTESLAEGLARKKFTSVDLVKAYLARIAEVNGTLHAVTEINPDALSIAAKLDLERSSGSIRGPLHGIPILIKNNIATKDKMNNTAGSWALLGAKVPRDATVAQRLRGAGAILLGKTGMSEWANFRSLNTSNGWSAHGGQVFGPYFPGEDPWGSSSGSGVAAALGLALGCLGTETDGSLIGPASHNNLVAIKPTVGLTSRYLVIPISEHQDTIGPMARTVKDAAYILQAIAGVDPRDNYTSSIPGRVIPDYISACKLSGLSGLRLGIPRNVMSIASDYAPPPIVEVFDQALEILRSAGATIVEDTNFTAAEEFWNSNLPTVILEADFLVNLHSYLASLTHNPNNITSLADLRKFTQSFKVEDYAERDTGLWDQALLNWNNTDPRFWPAYQRNIFYGGIGGVLGAMARYNLDAVILPSIIAADWAATVGSPIVTVPLGSFPSGEPVSSNTWGLVETAPNIPFGISFLGSKFSEAKLIGMAYAFEQRTKVRDKIQPYIAPRIELGDVVGK